MRRRPRLDFRRSLPPYHMSATTYRRRVHSQRPRSTSTRSEENQRPFGTGQGDSSIWQGGNADADPPRAIVPLDSLRRIGPSLYPWRGLLHVVNMLSYEDAFASQTLPDIRFHARLALSAYEQLNALRPSGRSPSNELYYRSLEVLFLQYEVFRLVRRALLQPHSHVPSRRPCERPCLYLRSLHVLLTQFREWNRPSEFVESTLDDPSNVPLQMHGRFLSLRRGMIQEDCFDGIADEVARYVARISAHTIDDEEWVECMRHINMLRINHPFGRTSGQPPSDGYIAFPDENDEERGRRLGRVEDTRNDRPARDNNSSFHRREWSHRSGSAGNTPNRQQSRYIHTLSSRDDVLHLDAAQSPTHSALHTRLPPNSRTTQRHSEPVVYTSTSQPLSQLIGSRRQRPRRPGITDDLFQPASPTDVAPLLGVTVDEHGSPNQLRRSMLFTELSDLRAPRTPWLRPRFLSEDSTEAPLSPQIGRAHV